MSSISIYLYSISRNDKMTDHQKSLLNSDKPNTASTLFACLIPFIHYLSN